MKNQESSSSPRVARRRARVRERILNTAASLFAVHGVDHVTLTDITAEADISRGNFYSHFDSKEALIHAICQPAIEYSIEQIHKLDDFPPPEAIEGILRVHAEVWRKFPGALLVMYQLKGTASEGAESGHEQHSHNDLTIFRQAAAMKLLRMEPELATKVIDTVGIPLLELAQETFDPDTFFVESMLRLLLRE